MEYKQLYCRSLSNSLTVYWRKPEEAPSEAEYKVLLDGKPAALTNRTHYTIGCLEPGREYQVQVWMDGKIVGAYCAGTRQKLRPLNVQEFGAAGDGVSMDTAALQSAIDACGPGEEVFLPAGDYKTGALRLHSDMALHLDRDAVLHGTADPEDYLPRIPSRFEGTELECYSSLLNLGHLDHNSGPNARNVLIYGAGTIISGGHTLAQRIIDLERERLKDYLAEHADLVFTCENDRTIPGRVRPRLINLSNCENVRITGLTLQNGASWNVHMIYCKDIVTDHCTFVSDGVWNGDGWDPDSSEDCTLFACRFCTEDDCVAIKSGKNPEGNAIGRPSRRIRVFDCTCAFGHGICMGSEMSGGIEDVKIWDCDLANSLFGLEIKGTKKRGGYVRDIQAQDCRLPRLLVHAVGYNDDGVPAPHPPVFEHFRFERLDITGRALDHKDEWSDVPPLELVGFDVPGHELRAVVLHDCTLPADGMPIVLRHCRKLSLKNLRCGKDEV